jgi:ketosteroid isomerase-like protein
VVCRLASIGDVLDSGDPIHVERVRAGFEAFGRGDWQFVQDWLSPDCQWEENPSGGFPGLDPVYIGRDGFAKWMRDTREAWDAIESVAEEIVEVQTPAGPTFIVQSRLAARGRQNIEVDWVLFNVLWTRNAEAVVRRRVYFDREEAYAAAALSESEIAAASPT